MIHIVIGTKAQLIKMAPVMRALSARGLAYNHISTGQHRETMREIVEGFGIERPHVRLYDGPDIASIPTMAIWALRVLWRVLRRRDLVFRGDRNGIVLVHGDTFSTLLGALMAKVGGLAVGHVESGLRSFDPWQPFPEELTRVATFRLADILFCPGEWAIRNLDGVRGEKVDCGANTLLDALGCARAAIDGQQVDLPQRPFGIVTLHRFENFRSPDLARLIVQRVEQVARHHHLLFVLHKPTELKLTRYGLLERLAANPRIELRPRYAYFEFMRLLMVADFVVSDGGSNQEECFYLGKPVLLLRQVTERPEGLGRNAVLSKLDPAIVDAFAADPGRYRYPPLVLDRAPSEVIVDACEPYAGPP